MEYHLQGSRIPNITARCVMTRNSADLIYFAVEALNHAKDRPLRLEEVGDPRISS
jgi:hypothetical protein